MADEELYWVTRDFVARVEAVERWIRTFSLTGDGVRVNRSGGSFSASLRLPRPPPAPPSAAGITFLYGKLTALWTPGTNAVVLTPCLGITDGTATGDPDLSVAIQFPLASPAFGLDAAVNDILPYLSVGTDGSGNPVYKLFDPPILPRPTALNQGIFNASGSPTAPHYVAQYAEGH